MPVPITAFAEYPHGSKPKLSSALSEAGKSLSTPSSVEMDVPISCPVPVPGWKNRWRDDGERWDMRISRVESWYRADGGAVGDRDKERLKGVTRDASEGSRGWEFGEVR